LKPEPLYHREPGPAWQPAGRPIQPDEAPFAVVNPAIHISGPHHTTERRAAPAFAFKDFAPSFPVGHRPTGDPAVSLTWGLGGIAATLALLQLGSSLLLKFVYTPTPVAAYASIQAMTTMLFGRLVRNLHYWCAHLLVAVIVLHLLRAFFTGAFHPPRQFNWVIGLGLLGTVLAANFTGYLLP
jgi:quinol-cytochrome oxidoreductase complex cytochrome b subunit